MCVCVMCVPQHVCEGQRTTEGVLSFHGVGLGDKTQVVSLDGKQVCLVTEPYTRLRIGITEEEEPKIF